MRGKRRDERGDEGEETGMGYEWEGGGDEGKETG